MFAIVESGSITSFPAGTKGFNIGDTQYPRSVFTIWSEAERNAIGLYTVEYDYTNNKDGNWYYNTQVSYAYNSGTNKVVGSYGTATAKAIDDTYDIIVMEDDDKLLMENGDNIETDYVSIEGLKSFYIKGYKNQAAMRLAKTDWYIVKSYNVADYSVPERINFYRDTIRRKSNEIETMINECTDVESLKSLINSTNDSINGSSAGLYPDEVI
tara:strand:+ start:215 stop:850 length:636 start_codon:yes stop_codon:yes gene_type:complete